MNVDLWGLGLQAINVLILVWLLSRVFWKPVADAIAARQTAVQAIIDAAANRQSRVDAALREVSQARAGIASERTRVLETAAQDAAAAGEAVLAKARDEADKCLAEARRSLALDTQAAVRARSDQAISLAVDVARKLLDGFDAPVIHAVFLERLIGLVSELAPEDRAALGRADIALVSAGELSDAEKATIAERLFSVLGQARTLSFVTDPDLIAGLDLRTAHFNVQNSWQADLAHIKAELTYAG